MRGYGDNSGAIDAPAAIDGMYADFKLVKTREVCQIVIEVPLDQGAAVVDAFGLPQFGAPVRLAVARIHPVEEIVGNSDSVVTRANQQNPKTGPVSQQPKADKTEGERAVTRAAILCNEPEFQRWIAHHEKYGGAQPPDAGITTILDVTTSGAAWYLRHACGVKSRRHIATDPDALKRFLAIETEYKMATGRMASPR